LSGFSEINPKGVPQNDPSSGVFIIPRLRALDLRNEALLYLPQANPVLAPACDNLRYFKHQDVDSPPLLGIHDVALKG
jgi:hypothetical protein